ncbi:trehalase family glycosidase [Micromonospora matsumotoense]|uniref:MGH1-like glycoside hydrolase domain-containing protein n=1 Tax=Micromonospora matsumotoense TaxID=121616 RepID=UPI00340CAE21
MTGDTASVAVAAASDVLRGNLRAGYSAGAGHEFRFTCPSPDTYPFQWSWDSAFHAIALSHLDPGRAQAEIGSLLTAVTPQGFLPHMLLWQDHLRPRAVEDFRIRVTGWTSATIAPPVLARAVEQVFLATGDRAWLRSVLPRTLLCYEWLRTHRTNPHTGLLLTFQPDESGLDSSPKYDEAIGLDVTTGDVSPHWHDAMRKLLDSYATVTSDAELFAARRFVWHDVLFNSIYADGLRTVARLCRLSPDAQRVADVCENRAHALTAALSRHCWDEERGVFWDLDVVRGTPARCLTVSSLFPLILEDLPAPVVRRLVEEHLLNDQEFWTAFPVPSVAVNEPVFDPDFRTGAIFRGSSWVNLNWYLHAGLRTHGFTRVADELARRTLEMTARSGMRECYGPFDGAGHAAREFGWSSLVIDLAAAVEGDRR